MDGAETLNALAAKKDLTLSDLNVFAETANQQAALLAKWITTFNSYDLEFIDTFSPQKDRVTLAKFYDRINELQINGRSTEALERMWLALNVLHTYLDNQLVPRLQEVVRVNDAAHTASAQIIEKVSQQRSSDQKEILDLRQQVGNQEATIRFYQEKTGNLNDKIELLQVYVATKNSGDLSPDMAALMLQVERLFAFDKTQPAAQADSRDNNGEEFITKESQQHKTKGVRLMKELL